VTLLLRQRFDVDLLLRLMAQEVRLKEGGGERSFGNIPADKAGYEMFRRIVLHLSAIQDQNRLYAEPLVYTRNWTIPGNAITAQGFQALEKEYFVTYDVKDNTYTIKKEISGPIYITNYDPDTLLPEERARMIEEAKNWHANDVSFDIRPNHIGGEYPMKGSFRLRSFHTILTFLGRSLGEDPEYHVEKDPRTPPVLENPANTMELVVSSTASGEADLSIRSHRQYYAVNTSGPLARWNRDAFQLLYLLFQMTVTEVPRAGVPSITIAK
jgi:hypothetical protein